jgi:probable HAF family extracellular repeat protein
MDMGGVLGYAAYAYDVSDGRVVVGLDYAIGRSDWETRSYDTAPFKWTRQDGYRNLGSLGGRDGFAIGVNRFGEIVGVSTTPSDAHAFFWSHDRGMVDLGPGVAYAINDELPLIVGERYGRATLWMGSGGVPLALTSASQPIGQAANASTRCFRDESIVRSKATLLDCLATTQ